MKKYVIGMVLLLATSLVVAQRDFSEKSAKGLTEDLALMSVIELLESRIEQGIEETDDYLLLANSYYLNADFLNANKSYQKYQELVADDLDLETRFRYAQSIKTAGNYDKADRELNIVYDELDQTFMSSKMLYKALEKEEPRFTIRLWDKNTINSDYPAQFTGANMYLITSGSSGLIMPWNNQPTSDIFTFNFKKDQVETIKGSINSKFNEGSCVVTRDGKTMYFTRNNINKNRLVEGEEGISRLKLYSSTYDANSWGNIQELPFNGDDFSVGHPALSNDEETLYFVSDIEGGSGKTDIYAVPILEDGLFGEIQNLAAVNTFGKELFPSIGPDGTLYFSSNGHSNLGGLDVFLALPNHSGHYETVHNMGMPINSAFDDFAFLIGNGQRGYFASNREGGVGSDDIYSFVQKRPFEEPCILAKIDGIVLNKVDGTFTDGVRLTVYNKKGTAIGSTQSNTLGLFAFENLDCNEIAQIKLEKNGYITEVINLTKEDFFNKQLSVYLNPYKNERLVKLNEEIKLIDPIYFAFDSYIVNTDSKRSLRLLSEYLNDYEELRVVIYSHTDTRGPETYNLMLSEKRAKTTANYLVSLGIKEERIQFKGYGELQPIEKCQSLNVRCTEYEHSLNRRSVFKLF